MRKGGGQAVNKRLEAIKAAIAKRHKSLHAFCRAHPELNRSTVYMLMVGNYPGDFERQAARIEQSLTGKEEEARPVPITTQEAHEVLQRAKCAHCRRLDKRGCPECNTQTAREAEALEGYLRAKGDV